MRFPEQDLIPMWYKISNQDQGKSIAITAHKKVLEHEVFGIDWSKAPVVADFKKDYGLSTFTSPCEGDWGFCNVLKFVKTEGDWMTWKVKMPVIKGKSEAVEDSREYTLAVRASLYLFVANRLRTCEYNTRWYSSQLIVIRGISLPQKDQNKFTGALDVVLTPAAIKWLAKQQHQAHLAPVIDAMKSAYQHMWSKPITSFDHFGALYRQPRWLNLEVPGDRCRLEPDGYGNCRDDDRGYSLFSHNVDSSLQQLTFLMGLAKLHDLMMADFTASPSVQSVHPCETA